MHRIRFFEKAISLQPRGIRYGNPRLILSDRDTIPGLQMVLFYFRLVEAGMDTNIID